MSNSATASSDQSSQRVRTEGVRDIPSLARELLAADHPAIAVSETIKALRDSNRQDTVAQLCDELITRDCGIPVVYVDRLGQLEAILGGSVPLNRRMPLQQQTAFVLERALANLNDEVLARRQVHYRLMRASLELGERPNAVRVARRLFERADDPKFSREIVRAVSLLPEAESPKGLLALAERLFGVAPDIQDVAILYLKQLQASGAPRRKQFELLQRALECNPDSVAILNNLARCALGRDRTLAIEEQAENYARRLVELYPRREAYSVYGRILLLRGKQAEALEVFGRITCRYDCVALGPIGEPLAEFCALCNKNYYYEPKTDLVGLTDTLARSRQRLEDFIAASDTITADDLETAARKLLGFNEFFLKFVRLEDVRDELGDQLGTLDPAPFAAIGRSLCEHVLVILEHGLSERILLRPIKGQEVIRHMASMYALLNLSLGRPGQARERLDLLASAGLSENVADLLQTASMFDDFEASGAFTRATHLGAANETVELHRMAEWKQWITAQDMSPYSMLTAPERQGRFSIVSADGKLHENKCVQQDFRLERVNVRAATLRNSELLIGPKGLLFRVNAIHGNYPPAGLPCLVGHTPNSVCMKRSKAQFSIEEPVVILANNNAARADSYGHWLIFLLTRLNAVVESGLLATRKVLLPVEMTSWMKETLGLIGLTDDKIILYPKDRDVVAADAEIISPIDASTGNLFPELRSKMYANAGTNRGDGDEKPYLYLARRTQLRRLILDEDKVYRAAEKLGYSIISPEKLTVAGQVRLFSQAKAIAGPGGSAFANMIFCRRGTRALCIKGEEKVSPLGLDLAVANGIDFRWLLGKSLQSLAQFTNPLDVPFEVDLDSLERHLAWATEAAPA